MTDMECACRVVHESMQLNDALPSEVFPLLCPVREAEWVPGWTYRMIYSGSGFAEIGCIFATPNESGPETIWTVTRYDPMRFEVDFAWVRPNLMATRLEIRLARLGESQTQAHIKYVYTALSDEGRAELASMDGSWFEAKMRAWQDSINFFLRTGRCIKS